MATHRPSIPRQRDASQAQPTAGLALTVCQPYAALIASGEKTVENRLWSTAYRGRLFIHAGLSRAWLSEDEARRTDLAFGAIVAVGQLIDCVPVARIQAWSNPHAHGPICWLLGDVRRLARPVPTRGARKLWRPDDAVVAAVLAQVSIR